MPRLTWNGTPALAQKFTSSSCVSSPPPPPPPPFLSTTRSTPCYFTLSPLISVCFPRCRHDLPFATAYCSSPPPLQYLLSAATDTIAVAGPSPRTSRSGSTRSPSLSLTLWRVRGRASPLESDGSSGIGGETHARSRRLRGGGGEGGGAVSRGSARTAPKLMELHFVSLEGGSLVVPAPRAGLDRAPPGTVPALLPLLFPGLRAVAPPVQVNRTVLWVLRWDVRRRGGGGLG